MLRFVLKRKTNDVYSGAVFSTVFTIDANVPDLESALSRGGYGAEQGYDLTELVGVEVLRAAPQEFMVGGEKQQATGEATPF
jgi:hypothetical protein